MVETSPPPMSALAAAPAAAPDTERLLSSPAKSDKTAIHSAPPEHHKPMQPLGRALFSTDGGTRPIREPLNPPPPVIARSNTVESVVACARSYCSRYPEIYTDIFPDPTHKIEDLWDPVDIQDYGRPFLREVLAFIQGDNAEFARKFTIDWSEAHRDQLDFIARDLHLIYDPKEPLALIDKVFVNGEVVVWPRRFLWHVLRLMRAAMREVASLKQASINASKASAANDQKSGQAEHQPTVSADEKAYRSISAPSNVTHSQSAVEYTMPIPAVAHLPNGLPMQPPPMLSSPVIAYQDIPTGPFNGTPTAVYGGGMYPQAPRWPSRPGRASRGHNSAVVDRMQNFPHHQAPAFISGMPQQSNHPMSTPMPPQMMNTMTPAFHNAQIMNQLHPSYGQYRLGHALPHGHVSSPPTANIIQFGPGQYVMPLENMTNNMVRNTSGRGAPTRTQLYNPYPEKASWVEQPTNTGGKRAKVGSFANSSGRGRRSSISNQNRSSYGYDRAGTHSSHGVPRGPYQQAHSTSYSTPDPALVNDPDYGLGEDWIGSKNNTVVSLWIGQLPDLPEPILKQEIKDMFARSNVMVNEVRVRQPCYYAFVDLPSSKECRKGLAMTDKSLRGKPVRVTVPKSYLGSAYAARHLHVPHPSSQANGPQPEAQNTPSMQHASSHSQYRTAPKTPQPETPVHYSSQDARSDLHKSNHQKQQGNAARDGSPTPIKAPIKFKSTAAITPSKGNESKMDGALGQTGTDKPESQHLNGARSPARANDFHRAQAGEEPEGSADQDPVEPTKSCTPTNDADVQKNEEPTKPSNQHLKVTTASSAEDPLELNPPQSRPPPHTAHPEATGFEQESAKPDIGEKTQVAKSPKSPTGLKLEQPIQSATDTVNRGDVASDDEQKNDSSFHSAQEEQSDIGKEVKEQDPTNTDLVMKTPTKETMVHSKSAGGCQVATPSVRNTESHDLDSDGIQENRAEELRVMTDPSKKQGVAQTTSLYPFAKPNKAQAKKDKQAKKKEKKREREKARTEKSPSTIQPEALSSQDKVAPVPSTLTARLQAGSSNTTDIAGNTDEQLSKYDGDAPTPCPNGDQKKQALRDGSKPSIFPVDAIPAGQTPKVQTSSSTQTKQQEPLAPVVSSFEGMNVVANNQQDETTQVTSESRKSDILQDIVNKSSKALENIAVSKMDFTNEVTQNHNKELGQTPDTASSPKPGLIRRMAEAIKSPVTPEFSTPMQTPSALVHLTSSMLSPVQSESNILVPTQTSANPPALVQLVSDTPVSTQAEAPKKKKKKSKRKVPIVNSSEVAGTLSNGQAKASGQTEVLGNESSAGDDIQTGLSTRQFPEIPGLGASEGYRRYYHSRDERAKSAAKNNTEAGTIRIFKESKIDNAINCYKDETSKLTMLIKKTFKAPRKEVDTAVTDDVQQILEGRHEGGFKVPVPRVIIEATELAVNGSRMVQEVERRTESTNG